MDATQQAVRQQVRMRGRSYVAFVFSPVVPIVSWLAEIDETLAKSPGFFTGKPVVLDLSAVDLSQAAIAHLVGSLGERNIRILGIEGVDESRLAANMPPLLTGGRACAITTVEPQPKPVKAKDKSPSLLLESPVRSGQSIVFAEGDVTVLGSVGSGAEIVAGGSIHVYGTLRGRAMAGINGNSSARIFCQKIEAELLAIDGYYQTAEQISDSLRNRPAQAWLEGEMLRITALN
ncbi:septum site-determining protein MinC [Bradyrhizobium sp. WSM 1704]|uniref:septum site-determining protein MinC n=1 Tax=Bradyrhizobium semiaridum TaxID=2821404 RepID=UPI001CE2B40B|nr:septum site-determining protein MinC [Bradyrhizobium semiaridum]MCA6126223.1 septum site-determining protein MinC [Bradyrhizobium semiaridum]